MEWNEIQCRVCELVFLLILSSASFWKSWHRSYSLAVVREISDRGKKAFETFHLVGCLVVSYSGFYDYRASLISHLHWDKDNSWRRACNLKAYWHYTIWPFDIVMGNYSCKSWPDNQHVKYLLRESPLCQESYWLF